MMCHLGHFHTLMGFKLSYDTPCVEEWSSMIDTTSPTWDHNVKMFFMIILNNKKVDFLESSKSKWKYKNSIGF